MNDFRTLTQDCGLSPKSLTRLLDGKYNTVSSWVKGNRNPPKEVVNKLTELSIEVKRIMGDKR